MPPKPTASRSSRARKPARTSSASSSGSFGDGLNPWLLGLLLAIVGFVLLAQNVWGYALFDVDEPRYAEAARQMLVRDNWITPFFNGVERFDKPPLFYWLVAGAYQLFGVTEWAARLPSVLSALALMLGLYGVGVTLVGRRFGTLAAVIWLTSVMCLGLSRMAITDMTLAALMGLSLLSLVMVAHRGTPWWGAAGFWTGLGILCKGPVALVLPGGIFVLYALWLRRFKRLVLTPWMFAGLLIALTMAAPWYIAAYQQNGQAFLDATLFHNVTRFQDVVSGHDQPWWFFSVVWLVGFLPWTPWLGMMFRDRAMQLIAPIRVDSPHQDLLSRLGVFGLIWALVIFLFFNVSQTRLLTYILPMWGGLTLWLAASIEPRLALRQTRPLSRWWSIPVALVAFGLLSATLVYTAWLISPQLLPIPELKPYIASVARSPWNAIAAWLMTGGWLTALAYLWLNRLGAATTSLAITMAVCASLGFWAIVPGVNMLTQGAMMSFVPIVRDKQLAVYEIQRPGLTFYLQRPIPWIQSNDAEALARELETASEKPLYIITKRRFVEPLGNITPESHSLTVLRQTPVYALVVLAKRPPVPAPDKTKEPGKPPPHVSNRRHR